MLVALLLLLLLLPNMMTVTGAVIYRDGHMRDLERTSEKRHTCQMQGRFNGRERLGKTGPADQEQLDTQLRRHSRFCLQFALALDSKILNFGP